MKSDMEIQKDVIAQLNWEPILEAAEIGVLPPKKLCEGSFVIIKSVKR